MTQAIPIPELPEKLEPRRSGLGRYVLLGLAANAVIWGAAVTFLAVVPSVYTSGWSLILPGAGAGTNVDLADVGQASSLVSSPYLSSALDPRANYKAVIESDTVLRAAAETLGMTAGIFGKPRVKLPDQTSVIEFTFNGSSPEEAQSKSRALFAAFEKRLDQLRSDESLRRERGIQQATRDTTQKLKDAQGDLLKYKINSGLVSSEQVGGLVATIEQLRKERAVVLSQQQLTTNQMSQLTQTMGTTPRQAANAFVLQADRLFQDYLKEYSESTAALQVQLSKWGPNHPAVIKEKARQQAVRDGLIERGESLLGPGTNEDTLQRLNLVTTTSRGSREDLLRDLVTTQAQAKGLSGQANELTRQIAQMERTLKVRTSQQAGLEGRQRNLQLAEAVFTSTLAKLDIGKSDIYASYPLVQMLIEPQLADAPSFPSRAYTLLGTLLASVLVTAGIAVLWLRRSDETA
ncbi:MAG: hypothetical protein H7Y22_14960 [Gemmatimonadaceae bacterium]|nr:hypothetical protein [Gloeobacterales cyanobacterium ES-bin-141]